MASSSAVAEGDPYRDYMYGEGEKDTVWRFGAPPNYDVVNKLFEEGRTNVWPVGSLEEKVQRLVKTWEMEIVHKIRPQDRKTMDTDKFHLSVNGLEELTPADIAAKGGSYNVFLETKLPKELRIYDPSEETAESSTKMFTTTFPRGFALEILEVYSGGPRIVYRFRHWSHMDGPFKGHAPTHELVEFFGIAIFHLGDDGRIVKIEFFYERGNFLASFLKGETLPGTKAAASACPVMNN